jgi:putative oxidoreductase
MIDKALGIKNTTLENVVLLASRLLLAWIFVHEGVFLATNFATASASMAKSGVPALALVATIGLQLVAGTQLQWDGMHVSVRPHWACFV